jgi:DNA replication protein DnaC
MYSSPFIVKYLQGVFDVVVLDGVGQERETEFSIHEVGSLLRRRYDDMRTVIITTTLPPLAFTRRYGDRVTNIIDNMHTIKVS